MSPDVKSGEDRFSEVMEMITLEGCDLTDIERYQVRVACLEGGNIHVYSQLPVGERVRLQPNEEGWADTCFVNHCPPSGGEHGCG